MQFGAVTVIENVGSVNWCNARNKLSLAMPNLLGSDGNGRTHEKSSDGPEYWIWIVAETTFL